MRKLLRLKALVYPPLKRNNDQDLHGPSVPPDPWEGGGGGCCVLLMATTAVIFILTR